MELEPRSLKGCYKRDVVLVVSALCYSAADIFAASFQDYGLGKVLGVDEHTGAGGAAVTDHSELKMFHPEDKIDIKDEIKKLDVAGVRERLLKYGGSLMQKGMDEGAFGERSGRWLAARYLGIDWHVEPRGDEPPDYEVSFLPWVAADALLAFAKTEQTMAASRSRIKDLPERINISFSLRRTVRQGKNNWAAR